MRILITNDDGIHAPGLAVLEAIAADVAGPTGEVFVVAPAFEQSGVGHCINYTHPTLLSEVGPNRFAAEGSPADCVLAGIHQVMKDDLPDLVLSGVNRGNNSAENVGSEEHTSELQSRQYLVCRLLLEKKKKKYNKKKKKTDHINE